jgi:predicted nucleic-acid-binding Zn-ribbon protein
MNGGWQTYMYYSKEQLEQLRQKGEEEAKKLEQQHKSDKYKSEADIQIICMHCKHEHFEKGEALLNTRGLTFLELDWLNGSAITLACKRCGFIHWFVKEVELITE